MNMSMLRGYKLYLIYLLTFTNPRGPMSYIYINIPNDISYKNILHIHLQVSCSLF